MERKYFIHLVNYFFGDTGHSMNEGESLKLLKAQRNGKVGKDH